MSFIVKRLISARGRDTGKKITPHVIEVGNTRIYTAELEILQVRRAVTPAT